LISLPSSPARSTPRPWPPLVIASCSGAPAKARQSTAPLRTCRAIGVSLRSRQVPKAKPPARQGRSENFRTRFGHVKVLLDSGAFSG